MLSSDKSIHINTLEFCAGNFALYPGGPRKSAPSRPAPGPSWGMVVNLVRGEL
jgi:hypothetical protein